MLACVSAAVFIHFHFQSVSEDNETDALKNEGEAETCTETERKVVGEGVCVWGGWGQDGGLALTECTMEQAMRQECQ